MPNSDKSEPAPASASASTRTTERRGVLVGAQSTPEFRPRLTKPHRLIQATQASMASRDPYEYSRRNAPKAVDIRVSKSMRRMSLIVMDRFIKALEAKDLRVEVVEDYRGAGTFVFDGQDCTPIHIHEKNKRIKHEPTAKEIRDKEGFLGTRIPKWDDVPTGELVLVPGGTVDLSSDQAINQLIEKAVADVIEELACVQEKRKVEEAARRREWEHQRKIEEEKQRVEAMHKAAEGLRQYRILADYIEEVRRFGRVPQDQQRDGQTLDEWLAWAEAQAQRIHPLGD